MLLFGILSLLDNGDQQDQVVVGYGTRHHPAQQLTVQDNKNEETAKIESHKRLERGGVTYQLNTGSLHWELSIFNFC